MVIKNELARKLCFFDGNVRFNRIGLNEPIEIWKILIELDINQLNKTPFKIIATLSNTGDKTEIVEPVIFEFDDTSTIRKMIFGNPFDKPNTLVNHIHFEYFDYIKIPTPLVHFWVYVYEVDEGTREDLFPFSTTE